MSLYTSNALAKAAGVTYRQINYWTTKGYLEPVKIEGATGKGTGHRLTYDETSLLKARLLGYLLNSETAGKLAVDLAERKAGRIPGFSFALTEWCVGPHRLHQSAVESKESA